MPAHILPLAHRLALVYLLLSVLTWHLDWFRWWIGEPLAAPPAAV